MTSAYWKCCDICLESGIHTDPNGDKPLEFPDPGDEGKSMADLYPEQYFFAPFWVALALDATDWLHGKMASLAWALRKDPFQEWPW